jgi:hypothetical protein
VEINSKTGKKRYISTFLVPPFGLPTLRWDFKFERAYMQALHLYIKYLLKDETSSCNKRESGGCLLSPYANFDNI